MVTIDQLMDLAYEKDASDIHLIAGERPVLRIYGRRELDQADLGEASPWRHLRQRHLCGGGV